MSFQQDIAPILKRRCAVCHITGQEPGKLSLVPDRALQSLRGAESVQSQLKRVEPGQPEKSYLLHKLLGSHKDVGGEGSQMPYLSNPLPKEQVELIRAWIEQGAPES